MRAKTVKRLSILLAVIALIGGSAYAAWRFQVGKMAQGVVEQADKAMEKNDVAVAVDLYQQHLLVVPEDREVQLKYADALLKLPRTMKHMENALGIYHEILNREPGRKEVRRRAAELALEIGGGMVPRAREHLSILLKSEKDDGHLEYLMGRCYENDDDFENAAKYYQAAIEHGTPERIQAADRLATLIRKNEKLGKAEDADKVIDDMVKADSGNYQVYLVRGHYRNRFKLDGAQDDFQKSLEFAPDQPETYREMSQLAERNPVPAEDRRALDQHRPFTFLFPSAIDVSRQILDNGLAAAPNSVPLFRARADIERKVGRVDRYIESLEAGVKVIPEQADLRLELAQILAARGETGKLMLHIEELKNLGLHKLITDYFIAYYHFNNREFEKAIQILTSIQTGVAHNLDLKARVNVLLAQCYGQLHEPEKEWEARQRAYNAKPDDVMMQAGWIDGLIRRLVNKGEIDVAIKEYQRLIERSPQLDRKKLVNLMLMRNQQRSPAQRNWREVEIQVDEAAKAAPNSVEPIVLRAIVYSEQDQPAKAGETLEAARSRFPRALELWTVEADVLVRQKKFDEALSRLDGAQKQLGGDRIELRLARATIWAAKGDASRRLVKALNGLARGLEPFPKEKRRDLLARLAAELAAQQDIRGAEEIWLRLVDDDPDDVYPHFQLFELARQAADKAGAGKQTQERPKVDPQVKAEADEQALAKAKAALEAQIEAIARLDETQGRFYRARYLTWQADRSQDAAERTRLRAEAHALLADLKARRDEWELIPLAEAVLEEQELAEVGVEEAAKRREKQDSIINLYLSAIELGSRNPVVVRRAVELLFAAGRTNEAFQLFSRVPAATSLGGDLAQMAAQVASDQNYQRADEVTSKAEEMARKAVAEKPGSFQARLWLVNILLAGKRTDEAEAELRRAVEQADREPVRWLTLINFLVRTKQLPKAEQALRDAEKKLPQAPLALAECCELLGQASKGPDAGPRVKQWFEEARQWFDRARTLAAEKDPRDLSVTKRLVQFLLNTDLGEAEKQLKATLQGPGAKDAEAFAWARRTLAMLYIRFNPRRPADALLLFDMAGPKDAVAAPEDKRVRANVLAAQKDKEHHLAAIEILGALVEEKPANPDDLHLLAQLEEAVGDWPKSRDQYRNLIERSRSLADRDARRRQADYIVNFAERLLQSHQPRDEQDLAEAQDLVEKLKRIQPDLMASLALEVELNVARNNFEKAVALIRSNLERPNLNPAVLPDLARMAEKIGQFDEFKLAEELYRKIASDPGAPFSPNKVVLIQFLVRRGRLPDALDLCESLRKNPADRVQVDGTCLDVFANPSIPALPEQINRVIGWFEEESRNGQKASVYQIGLGNLFEREGLDQKAEDSYRAVIGINDRDGIASNNLAWLMALNGGEWSDALDLINRAIKIKGPTPDYLDTRGVVYLSAGDFVQSEELGQRALKDLKEAIELQPTASKYFHLAQAYLTVKDKVNAVKSLELAKAKGLPNGLHRLERARYKKLLGELGQ